MISTKFSVHLVTYCIRSQNIEPWILEIKFVKLGKSKSSCLFHILDPQLNNGCRKAGA